MARRRKKDVALVFSGGDDGQDVRMLRHRVAENSVELSSLRPLEHGKSITGEVVQLTPRKQQPFLYDVHTQIPAPTENESAAARSGPARVSTEAFRSGWEAIWGASDVNTEIVAETIVAGPRSKKKSRSAMN